MWPPSANRLFLPLTLTVNVHASPTPVMAYSAPAAGDVPVTAARFLSSRSPSCQRILVDMLVDFAACFAAGFAAAFLAGAFLAGALAAAKLLAGIAQVGHLWCGGGLGHFESPSPRCLFAFAPLLADGQRPPLACNPDMIPVAAQHG